MNPDVDATIGTGDAAGHDRGSALPRACVLVAEDDDALRRLLELRLTLDGFDVLTAADGQEAIDIATGHGPGLDVVLCDIMMPRVSGLEVCRALRGLTVTHELPIILLTAHNLDAAIEAVMALGNIGFMSKPFNGAELREAISRVLGRRPGAGARSHLPGPASH